MFKHLSHQPNAIDINMTLSDVILHTISYTVATACYLEIGTAGVWLEICCLYFSMTIPYSVLIFLPMWLRGFTQKYWKVVQNNKKSYTLPWSGSLMKLGCCRLCLLPIWAVQRCVSWFPAHRESHSCNDQPNTSWTQQGLLSAYFASFENSEVAKERKQSRYIYMN